jgi:poly(A) polymerase
VSSLNPEKQSWMTDTRTRAVMHALTAKGGAARFVGGAVRNALIGEPVTDVDIATPLLPEEVTRRLKAAGLGAVPTGIAHGTVTAVADGKPFEVTTLRRDVATDGRRATVAFSADWQEDAARRDFTMNALYASEDGEVFDYFGGVEDLRAGRVRFVGDPKTRIREDYLRILRLFRFHAWYGKGEIDKAALDAAVAEKSGLKTLSGERVQKELLRLLEAKAPGLVLEAMERTGLLAVLLPAHLPLGRLRQMIALETSLNAKPDALLRLAALLSASIEAAQNVAGGLKFSNADRERLVESVVADEHIGAALSHAEGRKLVYRLGNRCFRDQLLLRWSSAGSDASDPAWRGLLSLAETWSAPKFPLDGRDVKAFGIEEGPRVGALLKEVEQYWIDADFKPDRAALLARLKVAARSAGR